MGITKKWSNGFLRTDVSVEPKKKLRWQMDAFDSTVATRQLALSFGLGQIADCFMTYGNIPD